MATIRPLSCIRPEPSLAAKIASGPHSSMSSEEIRSKIEENPLTYTRIVHPRFLYTERLKNPDEAYLAAADNLERWIREGVMLEDPEEAFYLYRLEYMGHVQTGLVGRVALDDIRAGRVRAHENVRENKLRDLAHHIELCRAQVGGPILMAYPKEEAMSRFILAAADREPMYHFLSENGVWNTIWKISDPAECEEIIALGEQISALYISDGHHRIMSAMRICEQMRRKHPDYTGMEPWNYVTCVCFASDQLKILPYARLITDRQGLRKDEILSQLKETFAVTPLSEGKDPERRGEFVMYLDREWYQLNLREEYRPEQLPEALDVSILHQLILQPIFGINNSKRENRLEFVGGETQLEKLRDKCHPGNMAGFLLYPTGMDEILRVADAGRIMPPKSTWFTPKLCNGLFIYRIFSETDPA